MASPTYFENILHAEPTVHRRQPAPVSPASSQPQSSSAVSPSASSTSNAFTTPATSPAAHLAPPSYAASNTGAAAQSSGHETNSSLYQCAHCLKKYSRPEHLQRHISSHTLGKRFVCDACGKGFGRADLLKRHRNNHNDDGNPDKKRRINSAPGASRVAHACQACAKARVKCEDNKPCTRCRQRNLTCEYASLEAGSAAAMHLMHLSASQSTTPQPHMAVISHEATIATPPNFGSGSMSYHQVAQPTVPLQGMQDPAAAGITNSQYPQSTGSSPLVLANDPRTTSDAAHQLPTPEAIADHAQAEEYRTQYQQDQNMLDMQRQPFTDFMSSVIYGQQGRELRTSGTNTMQGAGVLDYYDDSNLDMNDVDFGMLDHWSVSHLHEMIATDPNLSTYIPQPQQPEDHTEMSHMRKRLASIWSESPWRWMPDGKKDNIDAEKNNLSLGDIADAQLQPDRVVEDKLEPSCRDRIMAIVLEACPNNTILSRVASSFPSVEVMDSLAHVFMASHFWQVSEFVHFPTFSLNEQSPHWVGSAASAGAVSMSAPSLRKFGHALEEAVRVTLPMVFENNNSRIMDINLVQALVINQDISLWSGNRRRTEITCCHLNVPVAMVRGRLNFSISEYPIVHVDPTDDGTSLEEKWREWSKRESWKRLSFHLFMRDAQASMTSSTNPHISFTEMSLPLPAAREIWFAKNPQEWKHYYLKRGAGQPGSQLSLGDVIRNPGLLANEQQWLDIQFSVSIVLHAFWSMIHDFHKINTTYSDPALVASHRAHLVKTLDTFQRLAVDTLVHAISPQEHLMANLLQMNLHVSLPELQLFLGKEGDDQAKRIYPVLQQWAQGPDSRRAIWHAGQVLRFAKEFPMNHLKDFYAVAVHHAALTLWTWGVVTKARRRTHGQASGFNRLNEPIFHIDAFDSPHEFISYGTGRPAIMGLPLKDASDTEAATSGSHIRGRLDSIAFVDGPASCMRAVADIFFRKYSNDNAPPMVENLVHLVKQLGTASRGMGMD